MKRVSIIMPYYNAGKYILETVEGIIDQTYQDWELIIVDDCSPDLETTNVLQRINAMDTRIRVMKTKENGGAGVARNIAIHEARGRYLAFCDSDDWWYPTKLEEQIKFMEENNYPFTCTWYEDANERLETYYTMKQASRQSYKSMISGCNIGTPGVMIDTNALGKKEMPSLRRAEDWGFWMMYLKETEYLYTYPKAMWKYRHVPCSETSNKWKQMQAVVQMYQEVLGFSVIKAYLVAFFIFLPNNIWKKLQKRF